MKYMGSKSRHAKYILPIILKDRKPGQWYVEPFVGGANMIDKVDGNRIGADNNIYLIDLLRALSSGWNPPQELSEELYKDININPGKYPNELVGFAGIPCSYAAKWFGGYCRGLTSDGIPRDYISEAWRNAMKQAPKLKGINFIAADYRNFDIPDNSIIYCDPPYMGTTKYSSSIKYDEFWGWCNYLVNDGHTVFVSEYNAPEDWECVWEKEVNSSLTKDTGGKRATEKLFTKAHDGI